MSSADTGTVPSLSEAHLSRLPAIQDSLRCPASTGTEALSLRPMRAGRATGWRGRIERRAGAGGSSDGLARVRSSAMRAFFVPTYALPASNGRADHLTSRSGHVSFARLPSALRMSQSLSSADSKRAGPPSCQPGPPPPWRGRPPEAAAGLSAPDRLIRLDNPDPTSGKPAKEGMSRRELALPAVV
jgi:hypothetical protein